MCLTYLPAINILWLNDLASHSSYLKRQSLVLNIQSSCIEQLPSHNNQQIFVLDIFESFFFNIPSFEPSQLFFFHKFFFFFNLPLLGLLQTALVPQLSQNLLLAQFAIPQYLSLYCPSTLSSN